MSATHESTQDLLVSVHNTIYPINEQVLHQVFDPYGYVEKIDILQSSELLQAIVRFDSCQNAVWAKKQLQGRYIYDRCCQLDIQFYNKIDYEDKTENLLLENAFALDLDFIRNTLQEMMVIIERMQDRMKARNSSSLFTIAAAPTLPTTAATKSTAPAPPLPQTLGPAAPFLHLLSLPTMAPSSLVKPYNSTHQILKSFSDSHIEFLFGIPDTLHIMSRKQQLKIALNSFDKSKLVRAQIAIGCGAVFKQKYRKDETSPHIKMLGESKVLVFDPGGTLRVARVFDLEDKSVQSVVQRPHQVAKINGSGSCIKWLNKQAPNSVIYVPFGTWVGSIGQEKIAELALGLEASNKPFIWALKDEPSWRNGLPRGFVDRVKGRGKIVGWAPQEEVLGHIAVGCYMTHCGWNSTMEGIKHGKRMVCYPVSGDQFLNCDFIVKVWGIGVRVKGFGRRDVEESVEDVMEREMGKIVQDRVLKLKEKVMGVEGRLKARENLQLFLHAIKKHEAKNHTDCN